LVTTLWGDTMENGCEKCEGGLIDEETMWLVTGQEGNAPASITVFTCVTCGHQWNA